MAAATNFLQQPRCSATVAFSSCRASKAEPRIISQLKHDPSFVPKHKPLRLGDFNAGSEIRRSTNNVAVHAGVPPEAPLPDDAHDPCTKVGLLGATAAVFVLLCVGNVDTRIEQLEEISAWWKEWRRRWIRLRKQPPSIFLTANFKMQLSSLKNGLKE